MIKRSRGDLLSLGFAASWTSSSYLSATGAFATTTSESILKVRRMTRLNAEICLQRAQVDYVLYRLTSKKTGDKAVLSDEYFTQHTQALLRLLDSESDRS